MIHLYDKIPEEFVHLILQDRFLVVLIPLKDTDNADDIALLANTHNLAESLLQSLEQVAKGIGLHGNTNKKEYMYFNLEGAMSSLNGSPLKLVDKFTYLGKRVSSTERDVNMRRVKAWIVIERLSFINKSDLSNKIKLEFFQAVVVLILLYECTTWTLTKLIEKKLVSNCTRML